MASVHIYLNPPYGKDKKGEPNKHDKDKEYPLMIRVSHGKEIQLKRKTGFKIKAGY